MDNVYDRISVILDGKLVFDSIPRSPMAYFSPALSFAVGPGIDTDVEIDNVAVRAWYSLEDKNHVNGTRNPQCSQQISLTDRSSSFKMVK